MESKPKQEEIVDAILPPREWIENGKSPHLFPLTITRIGKHFIEYVSHQKASRVDVARLRETLDQKLMER